MKTWRALLGRQTEHDPEPVSAPATERWNTLSVVGVGSVADVDERGAIFLRDRPVSVEVWFGAGDRWVRGGSADGVRQSRVAGLPIVETRQRLGDADVIQTAWADPAGSGRGRVVISLENKLDIAAIVAVVVRPYTVLGTGRIQNVRIAEERIVVDGAPLVELGRVPGDTAGDIDSDRDVPALLSKLELTDGEIFGDASFSNADGSASFAALLPLTAGAERQIEVVDGREESTVAPAPLDKIVAGWRSHLQPAAEIDLPAWPKHIQPALMSSLLGAASDIRPLGDPQWKPHDDTLLVSALAGVGLYEPAVSVANRLLDAVIDGRLDRAHWSGLAAALAALVDSEPGATMLTRHGDSVTAVVGHTLSASRTEALVPRLLRVIEAAHGPAAAADAAAISGRMDNPEEGVVLAAHGVATSGESAQLIQDALHRLPRPLQAADIGLAMVASATIDRPFEPLVPMRSLAGSTWSWPRHGYGDSPHARAALLIGMRSLCVTEYPGSTGAEQMQAGSPVDLDLFPGTQKAWLGQNLSFSRLPTSAGLLSAAIRWHGARPALLWEISDSKAPFELRCHRLDPSFRSSEASGETLLAEPAGL